MFHRQIALAVVVSASLVGLGTGAAAEPTVAPSISRSISQAPARRTHPSPSHFTHGRVDNQWYPLRPGTRSVYRGTKDGEPSRDVFFVTYRTRVIDGVTCRVVRDRLFLHGKVRERTTDWYAQTKKGTVWYFGERTAELDRHGNVVSREGSFQSGRDGAEAGIFMPAHPRAGQSFKQEDYPGQAEDRFRILKVSAHVSVPVLESGHALLTKETTRLEPGVVDHKYYIRDIGTVREVTVKGGRETGNLVALRHVPRSR